MKSVHWFRIIALAWLLLSTPTALAGIDVHIRGVGESEKQNIKDQLQLLDYAKEIKSSSPNPARLKDLFDEGPADIRRALQPFGYYQPSVNSTLKHSGPDWIATYSIQPGPPTHVTEITLRLAGPGSRQPTLTADSHDLEPLKVGMQLNQMDYSAVKKRLLEQAINLGFLHARYTRHELVVNPRLRSARILWTLDTGPQFYFGPVTIEQKNGHLQDKVIRRYLSIVPNHPFAPSKILSTQFALGDLGYFKDVEVEPQKKESTSNHRIPVLIRAVYAKPRVYHFGIGYGTDTGLRALAGIKWRRLNSRGHTLSIDLRPSQKISTAVIDYKIPIGSVPGQDFDVVAQGLQQNFQGIHERLYSLDVARVQLNGAWHKRYYLGYTNDRYTIDGAGTNYSALLIPGVSFSRTSVSNPVYPRHGWFFFINLHGATKADQISNANFLSMHVKGRAVITVAYRLRLLLRAEEGALVTSDFNRLPPSQRFFAGGQDSVRGYAYNSLAPKDKAGNVIGGRYLTTGSVELDWDLWRPYGVAAFIDTGGAGNVPNVRLHFGAGLGFRYVAPFGTISVDFAHPFDRNMPLIRFYVGLGVGL